MGCGGEGGTSWKSEAEGCALESGERLIDEPRQLTLDLSILDTVATVRKCVPS